MRSCWCIRSFGRVVTLVGHGAAPGGLWLAVYTAAAAQLLLLLLLHTTQLLLHTTQLLLHTTQLLPRVTEGVTPCSTVCTR